MCGPWVRVIAKVCPVPAGELARLTQPVSSNMMRDSAEELERCRPCKRTGLGENALPLVMKMVKMVKMVMVVVMVIVINWDSETGGTGLPWSISKGLKLNVAVRSEMTDSWQGMRWALSWVQKPSMGTETFHGYRNLYASQGVPPTGLVLFSRADFGGG